MPDRQGSLTSTTHEYVHYVASRTVVQSSPEYPGVVCGTVMRHVISACPQAMSRCIHPCCWAAGGGGPRASALGSLVGKQHTRKKEKKRKFLDTHLQLDTCSMTCMKARQAGLGWAGLTAGDVCHFFFFVLGHCTCLVAQSTPRTTSTGSRSVFPPPSPLGLCDHDSR